MRKVFLTLTLSILTLSCLSQKQQLPQTISLYIPNAFTPDGDGINDTFGPSIIGHKSMDMYIYNRRGDIISHTNDGIEWDGKSKGIVCQEGIYMYIIYITDEFDMKYNYVGTVTLLKIK